MVRLHSHSIHIRTHAMRICSILVSDVSRSTTTDFPKTSPLTPKRKLLIQRLREKSGLRPWDTHSLHPCLEASRRRFATPTATPDWRDQSPGPPEGGDHNRHPAWRDRWQTGREGMQD